VSAARLRAADPIKAEVKEWLSALVGTRVRRPALLHRAKS